MTALVVLTLAFSPGVFWLWYFYKQDKLEPEPKRLVVRTFFLGMLAVVPAVILEFPIRGLVQVVILAPVVEELLKFYVVRRSVYRHAEFDEPMDGIVYAAAAALGFASVENALYLYNAYASGLVLKVFSVRALISVPGHVLFSSMWGYALGQAKFAKKERRTQTVTMGLLLAVLLHGLFNLLATTGPACSLGFLGFVVMAWWMARRRIARALADSPHDIETA